MRRWKVPERTKIGNVTFVPKNLIQVPRTVVEPCHHRSLPALLWRLRPPASTPKGVLGQLPLKSVSYDDHQLFPGTANASLLAGHPCDASIRVYCVTRSPCFRFDVPPPAAYLSPSPGRGCVPLECESILILKNKNRTQCFLHYRLTFQAKLIFRWFPAVTIALCLDGSVTTEARRAVYLRFNLVAGIVIENQPETCRATTSNHIYWRCPSLYWG